MGLLSKDSSKMASLMGAEDTFGQMVGHTMEIGSRAQWMEKESSNGLTEDVIMVSIKRTRNMVMVNSHGRMEGSTGVIGQRVSNMVKESSRARMERRDMVNGILAYFVDGTIKQIKTEIVCFIKVFVYSLKIIIRKKLITN